MIKFSDKHESCRRHSTILPTTNRGHQPLRGTNGRTQHCSRWPFSCNMFGSLALEVHWRPTRKRIMFVLLIAEAYRVMVAWYNLYPFEGSPEFIEYVQYFRIGWYICGLTCVMMYICTVSFYPIKGLKL